MNYIIILTLLIISTLTQTGFSREPLIPVVIRERSQLERMVKNHTYTLLVAKRAITLANGSFQEGDTPDNFISASLVQYKEGDINGDGVQDVVVIIEHHGMGSAAFYELSGLLQTNGHYEQTKPVLLGDNIEIKDFRILSNSNTWMPWSPQEISITMLRHKESDSHARPTLEETVCYYLENNELRDCKEQIVVKKPALYLYPVKKMIVNVILEPKGKIIQSIPLYNKGWRVLAESDGLLDKSYNYLFYEVALDNTIAVPEEGWSLQYNQLNRWFNTYLHDFGLNRKESADCKAYWIKNLPKSKYYTIKLISAKTVADHLGLKIAPVPESLLRVLLYFSPTSERVNLREPATKPFKRKGFTVVEWGGILGPDSSRAR